MIGIWIEVDSKAKREFLTVLKFLIQNVWIHLLSSLLKYTKYLWARIMRQACSKHWDQVQNNKKSFFYKEYIVGIIDQIEYFFEKKTPWFLESKRFHHKWRYKFFFSFLKLVFNLKSNLKLYINKKSLWPHILGGRDHKHYSER